jgi:hypothetical protein
MQKARQQGSGEKQRLKSRWPERRVARKLICKGWTGTKVKISRDEGIAQKQDVTKSQSRSLSTRGDKLTACKIW